MRRSKCLVRSWFFGLLLLAGSASAQTTWYVDVQGTPPGSGTQADPFTSIQYAIARPTTIAGDTVFVLPGTYFEQLDFLGKAITVESQLGASATFVDGSDIGSVVRFVSGEGAGSVLDGFTIQHGSGTGCCADVAGGGIYCVGASPTLLHLVVAHNRAYRGGGVYLEGSSAALAQCRIEDNTFYDYALAGAAAGIGIHADCNSTPTVTGCVIRRNLNGNHGGGIHGAGTYVDCSITENRATFGAGAYAGGCNLELVNCVISDNQASSVDADVGIGGGTFGGTLTDCTLSENHGGYQGGGAYQASLLRCVVADNIVDKGPFGGPVGVMGGGTALCDLVDCEVYGNRAGRDWGMPFAIVPGNGGGVAGGTASGCRIHHNTSTVNGACPTPCGDNGFGGGGAFDAVLFDCDVFMNAVQDDGGPGVPTPGGGGLFGGSATRCRIWQNSAEYGGGAADAELVHCTVHANVADAGGGGVADLDPGFPATMVRNSILWDDGSPETIDLVGTMTIAYSDVEGGASGTGNLNLDPRLFAPMSGDFHLKPLSPCIDTGDPASPTDPDGSRADMGAIPFVAGYCGPPGSTCLGKVNSLGCTPQTGSSGTTNLSGPDDFHVTASSVRNRKLGLLFWGRAPALPPFIAGTVCLRGPLVRAGAQNSGGTALPAQDCTGTFDFHFTHAYMAAKGIVAGDTIYAQWISRDPGQSDGTSLSYSDACEFTVCP